MITMILDIIHTHERGYYDTAPFEREKDLVEKKEIEMVKRRRDMSIFS